MLAEIPGHGESFVEQHDEEADDEEYQEESHHTETPAEECGQDWLQ